MLKMLFSNVYGVDSHPVAMTVTVGVLNGALSWCVYSSIIRKRLPPLRKSWGEPDEERPVIIDR
ncbi:MAG TPA: hypothetical protein VGS10_02280 [Terracidiphilus sp.]|nr:hypothetical protein [Terracidiphilus sp.]